MNGKKQRLELTWIGKDDRPKLEPRILLEDAEKSYARRRSDIAHYDDKIDRAAGSGSGRFSPLTRSRISPCDTTAL